MTSSENVPDHRRERMTAEQLLPVLYDELRRQAERQLSGTPPGQTLQPTALVHEAFLRLVGDADPGWDSRGHLFAAAGRAMREILVEQARRKGAYKRGGDRRRVDLTDAMMSIQPLPDDVLALDESLRRLESVDSRAAEVVELRYFAGLSEADVASVLGVSQRTARRDWAYARAWLHREMERSEDDAGTAHRR